MVEVGRVPEPWMVRERVGMSEVVGGTSTGSLEEEVHCRKDGGRGRGWHPLLLLAVLVQHDYCLWVLREEGGSPCYPKVA